MEPNAAIERLNALEQKLHAWRAAADCVQSDGDTVAPRQGAADHAAAAEAISGVLHGLMTSQETADTIDAVLALGDAADNVSRRRAEVLKEERDEMTRIPADEYAAYSRLISESGAVWREAKIRSDYASFCPYLDRIVETNRRFAARKDAAKPAYAVMLDSYEKGMTTDTLDVFFSRLREELTPVILAVKDAPVPDDHFLHRGYPVWQQRIFSDRLMEMMGIDRERCCIGETEHPFTGGSSRSCVRITTHYHEEDVSSSMYSVLHEGGHALYELGTAPELEGTVLGAGASTSIHESQSRFYENLIGRSLPFCRAVLPVMRACFPGKLDDVSPEQLWRAVNKSQPSLIRTEADELTYSMHVMIRYELERALMDGAVSTADLPGEWNAMYRKYLGVDVPDDRRGVLQDCHWPTGLIGYFPGYALGSAYGPQMLSQMEQAKPDLWQHVERGDFSPVTEWLGEKVHRFGRLLQPNDIVRSACGGEFNAQWYVDYLKTKYSELYRL